MRRLLVLVTALMFVELVFFTVLAPLLPGLKHELGLSTSQAGILVGAYALGAIVGGLPALALVDRIGVRVAALASVITFAATSVAFGLAASYAGLLAFRFIQGISGVACFTSAMSWLLEAAPEDERGAMTGFAFGVSEIGAIAGPLLGGVAAASGRPAAFTAVAVLCLGLAVATTRFRGPARHASGPMKLRSLLAARHVRTVMWITYIPAFILAGVGVLSPLQLHRLGASVGEIALTFGAAAALGILVRPLFGRWVDRRGPRIPIQVALLASFPFVLAVPWVGDLAAAAALAVLALVVTGLLWSPLMVMLSDACIEMGVGQATAVGVINLAWPPGYAIGATAAAAIAQLAGQRWAYALMATTLLLGYGALSSTRSARPNSAYAEQAP
jgi:MFS family permease